MDEYYLILCSPIVFVAFIKTLTLQIYYYTDRNIKPLNETINIQIELNKN